jgi:plasmid stabilization system protein ParE
VKLVIAMAAKKDMRQALSWYDARSDQAGDRFLEDLGATFKRIRNAPTRWRPLRLGDPRRVIHMDTFPYTVVFRVTVAQIRILVVRHDARREDFGLDRS